MVCERDQSTWKSLEDHDRDRDHKPRHHQHTEKHVDERHHRSDRDSNHCSRGDLPEDFEKRRERSIDKGRDPVERARVFSHDDFVYITATVGIVDSLGEGLAG